ncbi:MAG: hypothetical protein ACTS3F_14395 [Phycisphaerales bacterium]
MPNHTTNQSRRDPATAAMLASIRDRFGRLPRSARWLTWFVLALVAYFAIIEPTLVATADSRAQAQSARDRVERLEQRLASLERAQGELASAITDLGAIMPLGEQDERSAQLRARVTQILTDRGFTAWDLTQARPIPIPRGALDDSAIPAGRRIVRVGFDIQLEGSPDAVLGVLADLERAPEVTMVRQASVRRAERDARGFLSGTISPEVWVLAPNTGGGT